MTRLKLIRRFTKTTPKPYRLHFTSEDLQGGTWSIYVEDYAHRDAPEPIDGTQRLVEAHLPDEATAYARSCELQRKEERHELER